MQDEPEAGLGFSHKMSLKGGSGCWGLIISMEDAKRLSLEQIRAFLAGSEPVRVRRQGPEGSVRLGGADAGAA